MAARLADAISVTGANVDTTRDVTTFEAEASAQRERTNRGLRTVQLATAKRAAFYALGGGEALLLDAIRPDWRKGYAGAPYTLDGFFPGSK